MFKNHLKIALRNIFRSKGYSALNILGLATGMAVIVKGIYSTRINKLCDCLADCILLFTRLAAAI
jgi:hypothetical protein